MNLYTRTGDDGTTGLYGSDRVRKDDIRIVAIGDVDELNCALGVAVAACDHEPIAAVMRQVQHMLFDVGADLATPLPTEEGMAQRVRRVDSDDVSVLEQAIDHATAATQPLKQFILPGGTPLAAHLHLARAICRRAERTCVALQRESRLNGQIIILLNRVSDLLFALARQANELAGVPDIPWQPRGDCGPR